MPRANKILILNRRYLLLFFISSSPFLFLAQPDSSIFRKNLFSVKGSVALLISKINSFHYESFPLHPHDYYRNFEITEESSILNPEISIGYNRRLSSSKSLRNRTKTNTYLSLDIGWRSYIYKNEKKGYMFGGMSGGLFVGTIEEKNTLQYITYRPGFQVYVQNFRNITFGLGVGFCWSRIFFGKFVTAYNNEFTNKKYSSIGLLNERANPFLLPNKEKKIFYRNYDHFILDINFSIGKEINNHLVSLFIKYSVSDYFLLNKPYKHEYDSSFLKNFYLINVGIQYTL